MSNLRPISDLKNNQFAIADLLTKAFDSNDLGEILAALKTVLRAQNVKALAENGGIRRDGIYRTFDGTADPKLSSILKLLAAMNVQLVVKPLPTKAQPPRPKLGRPLKPSE